MTKFIGLVILAVLAAFLSGQLGPSKTMWVEEYYSLDEGVLTKVGHALRLSDGSSIACGAQGARLGSCINNGLKPLAVVEMRVKKIPTKRSYLGVTMEMEERHEYLVVPKAQESISEEHKAHARSHKPEW